MYTVYHMPRSRPHLTTLTETQKQKTRNTIARMKGRPHVWEQPQTHRAYPPHRTASKPFNFKKSVQEYVNQYPNQAKYFPNARPKLHAKRSPVKKNTPVSSRKRTRVTGRPVNIRVSSNMYVRILKNIKELKCGDKSALYAFLSDHLKSTCRNQK